jgi:hypothetical protein
MRCSDATEERNIAVLWMRCTNSGKDYTACPDQRVQTLMPIANRKPIPSADRRRALRVLADSPDGCTESLMMAHGFTMELLADLVRDGW